MNKLLLTASVLAAAFATGAGAAGSLTGQITLTGQVTPSCQVGAGGNASSSFSQTIALGELDQADGTLRPDLEASTVASPSAVFQTEVTCNTLTPKVSVTATELIDPALTVKPNYSNAVNYTASAIVTEIGGSDTFSATTNGAVPGQTGPTQVSNPIANQPNNLTIEAYQFSTVGGTGDVLLSSGGAASYVGVITVDITPS